MIPMSIDYNYLIELYEQYTDLQSILIRNYKTATLDYDKSLLKGVLLIYYYFTHQIPNSIDDIYDFILKREHPTLLKAVVIEYNDLKKDYPIEKFMLGIDKEYENLERAVNGGMND